MVRNPMAEPAGPEVIWAPQPGPQTALISCPADEIFYGGARGGGKTDGALGDWLAHEHRWKLGARGILFRHTYPELEEVQTRMQELYPRTGAIWGVQARTWTWPSGATLKLRYLERVDDCNEYQGHQYTWMAFEEAGTWPSPAPLDRMRGTLRSPRGVKCRVMLTGNPGGSGQEWLRKRFVDPSPPLTPFRDPTGTFWRVFIPAKLSDNRILTGKDPGYADRLKTVGEPWLVRAWLEGDWTSRPEGSVFRRANLRFYEKAPADIRKGMNVYLLVDPASSKREDSDYTAIWAVGLNSDGNYYVLDMVRARLDLEERTQAVFDMHRKWQPMRVGYERYGLQADTEHIRYRQGHENYRFDVVELAGKLSKTERVSRLVPSMSEGRWWFPQALYARREEGGDENLVQIYIADELELFPYGAHDDLLDAQSRILDPELSAVFPRPVQVHGDYAVDHAKKRNWRTR